MIKRSCHTLYICLALCCFACTHPGNQPPYQDLTHFSKVFGTEKYYRLYLPEGYHDTEKNYPVIYFFPRLGRQALQR